MTNIRITTDCGSSWDTLSNNNIEGAKCFYLGYTVDTSKGDDPKKIETIVSVELV